MRSLIFLVVLVVSVPANAEEKRLAVLEFRSDDASVAPAVLAAMADDARSAVLPLVRPRGYLVLTRESMASILKDMGKKCATEEGECEVETGRNLGVDLLVTGSVVRVGSVLRMNLKMFQVRRGDLLSSRPLKAARIEDLADAVAPAVDAMVTEGLGLAPAVSVVEPVRAKPPADVPARKGLFARLRTSLGDITCELFPDQAPRTVENFVGLAEGTKEWTNPAGQLVRSPLYSGTTFHRVIPDFMIQGGDPLGTGTGGPGYKFADELAPDLRFDAPGVLAMANSGPNSNGSQFFIADKAAPWLDRKHTIFGRCADVDVVARIARVKRGARDVPVEPVVLQQVVIVRGTPAP